jgi:hypothetical protein
MIEAATNRPERRGPPWFRHGSIGCGNLSHLASDLAIDDVPMHVIIDSS